MKEKGKHIKHLVQIIPVGVHIRIMSWGSGETVLKKMGLKLCH